MDAGTALRETRIAAGLTQSELASRVGTSQATISSYENGSKEPSVTTLSRLLRAMGARLTVEHGARAVREPSASELKRAGRVLADVLDLAGALPVRHDRTLTYPRLGAP